MPRRKKATLRELRTAEAHLEHLKERDKAFTNGLQHVQQVMNSGAGPAVIVKQLHQAIFEVETALRVAHRMHELRMQEIQTTERFPDES